MLLWVRMPMMYPSRNLNDEVSIPFWDLLAQGMHHDTPVESLIQQFLGF